MNVPAAHQIRAAWPRLLGWWGGAAACFTPTVHGAWQASCLCVAAGPAAVEGTTNPVPAPLSALYKASLGLNQSLLQALLRLEVASRPLADLGDGDAFMAWCDREGLLLGQREVCAGSPGQIAEAWDALIARQGDPPPVAVDEAARLGLRQAADLALMAATYQGLRRGEPGCACLGCRMLRDRPESWMDCPPDRQPEAVLGLYPEPPSALLTLLAGLRSADHADRESAWKAL